MGNYTPGPWEKDYNGSKGHIKSIWSGHRKSGNVKITPTVCKYETHPIIIPSDQQEANANLLAAAPDLLEALEWCAGMAYAGGKSLGDVEPVKSALAKARGENDV